MANRRDFLKASTVAGSGMMVSSVGFFPGTAEADDKPRRPGPNDRINVACIGVGGRGGANLSAVAGENVVAICDVDVRQAWRAMQRFSKVPFYLDFRAMLEKQRNIEAVVVSTPDHQHAVAAAMAIRMGKHVYCEKPLTHDVYEARQLRLLASKHRVATQMGNQGTSTDGLRTGAEVVQSGAIGEVREVHVWTNRPIWPQNIAARPPRQSVPQGLHWDLWLGTAPERDYNEAYVPFKWRGWWDFGTGAIGDMACHTMNLPYMALRLRDPVSVVADVATKVNNETAPEGCTVTYEFPARGSMPPCRLYWYERRLPPAKVLMGRKPGGSGSIMVGSKGTMYCDEDYGQRWLLLPQDRFQGYQPPKPTMPRSGGRHHQEWLRACKGGPPAMSNFDYAGPLTEMALLGNVAIRVGQRIQWDAASLRATNCPAADRYIRREYRRGWTL
jgi:predicted dehydrogenase